MSNPATAIFTERESEVRSYCRNWPVVFDTSKGAYQTTEDGERYTDFFSGAGALNYGHNNDILKEALVEYISRDGVTHSMDMHTKAKREFLEAFTELILEPRGMTHKIQFPGPTGTNAVETALKTARKATGREDVVHFTNAFHGMTLGSLAVTGNAFKRAGAGTPLYHATAAPYDDYIVGETSDFAWLKRIWADSGSGTSLPAAVIVETVQGEGGLKAARGQWLKELQDLCREYGVLMIVDDVQAGCGRTGTFFSFEDFGLDPDIITLSKSISGYGLPMALTLMKPEIDDWEPGEHNGTFRGHNPAFVTGAKALRTYWADDTLEKNIAARAQQLTERLEVLAGLAEGSELRGRGLLSGVAFKDVEVAEKIAKAAFARKLLVETSGPSSEVVKIMPPLTITQEELAGGLDQLEDAAREVLGAPARTTA
ncbi:diaminobutyrate--2-oxoglutarate transaminase [Janibacter sp. Soil728]|uniref:diaminobutyrate--2-oxoglutarate transaminase n=1 Tax=Janibacter sp. Soil728 TaxID=1736393 RepID=UPI0006FB9F61|nr:diaminobutyrate--2-oxoglutarate transaminase [Janibacter sp. Soil728]KRE37028.1 diaminobutyrate--2-oxoglutarate transaminase [Janibacter sp. Soil728]